MKKLISIALVLCCILNLVCVPAFAAVIPNENGVITTTNQAINEWIEEKAVEAFPEYAATIRGEKMATDVAILASTAESDEVVVSETRTLSDNEQVFYSEYQSGRAVYGLVTQVGKNVTNTVVGTTYTTYTFNAWLTCTTSEDVLLINNISLRTSTTGTGTFVSRGTPSTASTDCLYGMYKATGTYDDPAYSSISGSFDCLIGQDTYTYWHALTVYNYGYSYEVTGPI